jgi:hypothetical protein
MDLDLELAFLPEAGTGEPVRRRWNWPLIQPGQRYQFGPPDVDGKRRPDLATWAPIYPRVTLAGNVRDQLGKEHPVDVALVDLPTLRDRAMAAGLASTLRQTAEQKDLGRIADALEDQASS